MAPELMTGARRVRYGASADVYSFGMLAWSVYARARPFSDAPWRTMPALQLLDAIKRGSRPAFDPAAPKALRIDLVPACWGPRARRPAFSALIEKFFATGLLAREWRDAEEETAVSGERGASGAEVGRGNVSLEDQVEGENFP